MQKTLLLVDDVKVNREILKKILGSEYLILEAANGQEALAVIHREAHRISAVLLDLVMPGMDGYEVLSTLRADAELKQLPVIVATCRTDEDSEIKALLLGANEYISKPYNPTILKRRISNVINLHETAATVDALQRDPLTGLYSRTVFFEKAAARIRAKEPGFYVLACFNINNFKVINDQYGTDKGDEVLRAMAQVFGDGFSQADGLCSRIMADSYAVLYPYSFLNTQTLAAIRKKAATLDGSIPPISFSIGRYIVDDLSLSVSAMYDRALLAQGSVKGRYDQNVALFDESMRKSMLAEQQIVMEMDQALAQGQFETWYQPQYNHATGDLLGAEALVRWRHPKNGLIAPSLFIPVFEKNGFIYELDKYIWEQVCRNLRRWIDQGRKPLPISVNISRCDVFRDDLIAVLCGLVEQYQVPVELLRLEITESAFSNNAEQIITTVKQLIERGFTVEIDDFGSGYSSLNTLKDVPAQIIKLDMKFLESSSDSQRGGNILESIVRMAKWLGMSVIAEGVETQQQADFLKSIGCIYIQGYLYAKPMPEDEYKHLAARSIKQRGFMALETVETLDNNAFWNPDSVDTLIFNNYLGSACIYEYHKGRLELLRANDKYIRMLDSAGMTFEDALKLNWSDHLDQSGHKNLSQILRDAAEAENEYTTEFIFRNLHGSAEKAYLRATLRVIATVGDRMLIYCTHENITAQRLAEQKRQEASDQLRAIMDNINGGVSAEAHQDNRIRYLFGNDKYYALFGYTKEQFAQECPNGLFDRVHPADLPHAIAFGEKVSASGKPSSIEYRVRKRDGREIWVRSHISTCRIDGVDTPVLLAVTVDITAQKETTEQLRFLDSMAHDLLALPDTEVGISTILQNLLEFFRGDRAYVFEMDFSGGTMSNAYEYCAPGILSEKSALQNLPLDSVSFWLHAFDKQNYINIEDVDALGADRPEKAILQAQQIRSLVAVPLRRNGHLIGFVGVDGPKQRLMQIARLSALGDYIAVMLTRRDLNAQISKETQEKLAIMDAIPGGFVRMVHRLDGTVVPIYRSKGFQKLVGMDAEMLADIYGNSATTGVHPDDMSIVKNAVAVLLSQGEVHNVRYRLRNGRNSYTWVTIFGNACKGDAGETYFNIYYADGTAQKRREDTQIALLDNLPCGAALYDFDGTHISVVHLNRNYWELVERSPVAYETISILDAVHPEDRDRIIPEVLSSISKKHDAMFDIRILCGDGAYRMFHVVGHPIEQGDGKYKIYTAYTRLSDEASAMRKLLPVLLSTIMESTSDLSFVKDHELRYVCGSQAFARLAGVAHAADLVGKTDYDLFEAAIADKYRHDDEALLQSGDSLIDMEEVIPSTDGLTHYASTSKHLLRDSCDNILGIYGVGRDITKSRDALDWLKLLADNLPGGIATYVCKADNARIIYFNDGLCRLFGYTRKEYESHCAARPLQPVVQEDRAKLQAQLHCLVNGAADGECVFRARTKDGKRKWINIRFSAVERRHSMVVVNAILIDVTQQQETMAQLRLSERENRLAVIHSGNILCRFNIAERSLSMTQETAARLGMPEKVLDVPDAQIRQGLVAPGSEKVYAEFFYNILRGDARAEAVYQFKTASGWRWQEVHASTIVDSTGRPTSAIVSCFDVTDRLEKEAVYRKWQQSLTDRAPESYSLLRCNLNKDTAFERINGSLLDASFTADHRSLRDQAAAYAKEHIQGDDRDRYLALLDADGLLSCYYDGKRYHELEYRELCPTGVTRWLRLTIDLVERPNSADIYAYFMFENIDHDKTEALKLKERAESDSLTGVLNRAAFAEKLDLQIARSQKKSLTALLILDLDNFKHINDQMGHIAGDNALVQVSQALASSLRSNDLTGRLGGDEFLACLFDIPSKAVIVRKAAAICTRMRNIAGFEGLLSVSIGVAVCPNDGTDFQALYRKADVALYQAKAHGKSNYAFYDDSMPDCTK